MLQLKMSRKIVVSKDNQHFTFSNDWLRIRAALGYSVDVDLAASVPQKVRTV